MTKSYDNTFTDPGTSAGWITFDIQDYSYNGTDNLVIAVDENMSGAASSNAIWKASTPGGTRRINAYGSSNIDPSSPSGGNTSSYMAQIQIELAAYPVELISFTASVKNNMVELIWLTASEVNTIGFILHRKQKSETEWHEISGYATNKELVCLNNQIGNAEYSYTDATAQFGATYTYRLSDVDLNGSRTVLEEIQVTMTGVAENSQTTLPEKTELMAAYPNPFNPQTKICYQLAEAAMVDVSVHNILGRKVRQLVSGVRQSAGNYSLLWDAGKIMSSGVYIIVFKAGNIVKSQKVVLIR